MNPRFWRAGELDKVASVMRPSEGNLGTRGEKQGEDETVYADWPCAIEDLAGTMGEKARQRFPAASLRVRGYTDPANPILPLDYIQFGARRLNVIHNSDEGQVGIVADLLCGES